ncbi:MAG: hypothetical protein ACPG32_10945 [Akkermansiaceae bacterium]
MTIFNPATRCVLASGLILSLPAHADEVSLSNGDKLSGTIKELSDQGLTLDSPLAKTPLQVKSSAVRKVTFDDEKTAPPVHPERLTLINGDVLPCKVISMDKETLHFSTQYAGEFRVARNQLRALQFGITKEKLIYDMDGTFDGWTTKNGSWSVSKNTSYSCSGSGQLAREFDLPENFRVQCMLEWQEVPNFSFRFCGENDRSSTKQNTYEFIFNSAGMQLQRYENANQPAASMASIPFKPGDFASRSVLLDFRVNRSNGTVSLSINNTLVATWYDPFDSKAAGNFMVISSRVSKGKACTISKFKVTDWRNSSLPRRRLKVNNAETDFIIDDEANQLSGNLLSISGKETNQRTVILEKEHSEDPLSVPDRKISSLYFKINPDAKPLAVSPFKATLHGQGSISLTSPSISGGKISSTHPILGKVSLNTKMLRQITNTKVLAKDKAEKSKEDSAKSKVRRKTIRPGIQLQF